MLHPAPCIAPHAASPCPPPHASPPALQPSLQALQERSEQLWRRIGALSVQLEEARALRAQFWEAQAELQPWLQEAQEAAAQLCPDAIRCGAFREQQAMLQVSTATGRMWGDVGRCCPIAV